MYLEVTYQGLTQAIQCHNELHQTRIHHVTGKWTASEHYVEVAFELSKSVCIIFHYWLLSYYVTEYQAS